MPYTTRRDFVKLAAATALAPAWLTGLRSMAGANEPYADASLQPGPPPMPEKDSFTIVVLPDTQGYTMRYPENFIAQTRWIVEQQQSRNIVGALHLGDITNNNTPDQWENAIEALQVLDDRVPYFMTLGNHDYSDNGQAKDRSTLFHEYFPRDKYSEMPNLGGSYDQEPDRFDNGYYFLTAGGRDLLVLSLEFGPRNDVLRWANEVAGEHQDHQIILITHAYVYYDDTRYDWSKYGKDQWWNPHSYPLAQASDHDVNDGQQMWDKLISRHENFIMTLNGHVCADGLGRLSTPLPSGKEVPQVLVNFQVKPNGGDGWLRLLEFRPEGKTVMSYDYSVTRNECNVAPDNTFAMTVPS